MKYPKEYSAVERKTGARLSRGKLEKCNTKKETKLNSIPIVNTNAKLYVSLNLFFFLYIPVY